MTEFENNIVKINVEITEKINWVGLLRNIEIC